MQINSKVSIKLFIFIKWIRDKIARGQISHHTFNHNPQYKQIVSVLIDPLQETFKMSIQLSTGYYDYPEQGHSEATDQQRHALQSE